MAQKIEFSELKSREGLEKQVTFRLTKKQFDMMQVFCKKRRVTKNQFLRYLIEEFLKSQDE